MRCVICGSICEIWLTKRKKPAKRKPKVSMMGNRRQVTIVNSIISHASVSIVS